MRQLKNRIRPREGAGIQSDTVEFMGSPTDEYKKRLLNTSF